MRVDSSHSGHLISSPLYRIEETLLEQNENNNSSNDSNETIEREGTSTSSVFECEACEACCFLFNPNKGVISREEHHDVEEELLKPNGR